MKKINSIVIVILAVFVCGLALRGKFSGEKFDSTKWQTADLNLEDNWSLRWDMMNSLRNNYELVGMSKSNVIKLLGKLIEEPNGLLSYSLGYTKTGINTGLLTLKLNGEGIVTEINVRQS